MTIDYKEILKNAPLGATHYNNYNECYYKCKNGLVSVYSSSVPWGKSIFKPEELAEENFQQLNFSYNVGDIVKYIETDEDIKNNIDFGEILIVAAAAPAEGCRGELLRFTDGRSCYSFHTRLINKCVNVVFENPLSKTVDICQQEKPPLGVKPEYIFCQELENMERKMKEGRYEELFFACLRYCDGGKVIPREWIVELNQLRSNSCE